MPTATATLAAICGVFGLLIGSFLNVVIWRVPRGESIVRPPSACPACGHTLRPYDNVPLLSWMLLRARCRDCGAPISARYPVVELTTGVLFALMPFLVAVAALPAYLWLAGAGVALAAIDLDTKRLPNAITYPTAGVVGGWLVVVALVQGAPQQALRTFLGGVAFGAFFLLLHIVYPRGMGMGDVKLAVPLGFGLAWISWGTLLIGGFAAFFLGSLVGIGLMVAGKAGRRTALPFGPFMLAGALVALAFGEPIGDWYASLL